LLHAKYKEYGRGIGRNLQIEKRVSGGEFQPPGIDTSVSGCERHASAARLLLYFEAKRLNQDVVANLNGYIVVAGFHVRNLNSNFIGSLLDQRRLIVHRII
jgi:hypothetical protein